MMMLSPNIKIILRLCGIFLIIMNLSAVLCAEEQEDTANDPFLSMEDRAKLSSKPFDLSQLPYAVVLNGIIWRDNLRLAILNNEMVEEGVVWRDFKVEEIFKDKVVLKWGDNRFEVLMPSED